MNHGLDKAVRTEVFEAAEKFFKLPFEEKKRLDAKKMVGHRGYDVLASQSYEEGVMPDLKEVRGIVSFLVGFGEEICSPYFVFYFFFLFNY